MSADHEEHTPEHYNKIAIWLVILAIVSWLGPMLGIKVITLITAFGIACVKAYLVCKHFMHLNVEKRYVVYLLTTALAFMFLFYAGVAPDVMQHDGRHWDNVAAKTEVDRAAAAIEARGEGHH